MTNAQKIPVIRNDDNELLGYITRDTSSWHAQTIFGYTISRTSTKQEAEAILQSEGLQFLTGVWQYLDQDDHDWHPCVLREVYEHRVIVTRTNIMGYPDPDDQKVVIIKNPSDTTLIKAH